MLLGLIYSLISAFAFGSMAIIIKIGYNAGMTGGEMMQYRFVYAVLVLFVVLLIKDRSLLKISRSQLGKCAFIGLIIYWLQTSCFVNALATIPASTASLVLYVHPIAVTLISALLLNMKIDRFVTFSLALVMTGCCLVFYDAFLKEVDMTGLMYGIGAMVFYSFYLVLVQVLLKGLKPLTATFYVMLFASISFTISGDPSAWLHATWEHAAIGFSLGVLPGVIAVAFLYTAIEKIGSTYTCIFSSVEPVVTLVSAGIFLNENIVLLQIGGASLIIAGIIVPNARALMLKNQISQP
jgi:drug/metabolite transporter (DMT)-like permease